VEEEPANRGAGVDALLEYAQFHAALLELGRDLGEVLYRAAEPVEFGDDQDVAGAEVAQRGSELGSGRELAGGGVDEQLVDTGISEQVALRVGVLVAGGYPAVSRSTP
jgi:hypothetical protein